MMKWISLLLPLLFAASQTGDTVQGRFAPPSGYKRASVSGDSFAHFLRRLPLKPKGSQVTYYNGSKKTKTGVYAAVVDLPIGKRDLHQCADAVMRLRADYLFSRKRYDEIRFNFTNGFKAEYSRWRRGERISVKGSKVSWVKAGTASDSRESYWNYLETVFSYAGTASLEKELKSVPIADVQPGDVFIKGGFPAEYGGRTASVLDIRMKDGNNQKFGMTGGISR